MTMRYPPAVEDWFIARRSGRLLGMATIEVRGLRKTYGATVAVDTIDLDVAEGEILGILGPNGSGKTTTVECMAGLRRPDSGTVRVAGFDPAADRGEITRLVGVQLQQAGLQAKLTPREAIELYASFFDDPVDGVALAERLGLGAKLDTRYADLSGGQQQRLAIALALVGRPRIALLDELSTGLDPRSRRDVWQVVEEARAGGATIVLVTHLMEEARHLCDRVAIIDRGRVAAIDTPEGVIGRTGAPTAMSFAPSAPLDASVLEAIEGVTSARAREDGRIEVSLTDDAVTEVLAWLNAHEIRPGRLRVVDSTLDDAFLDLTSEDGEDG
jgi:ABC-2 type transport system ATP-binding protein